MRGHRLLRVALISLDFTGAFLAWGLALLITGQDLGTLGTLTGVLVTGGLAMVTVLLVASQKLYLARVCSTRAVEAGRLLRALSLCAILLLALEWVGDAGPARRVLALGISMSFVLLMLFRGGYTAWLKSCRARGLFSRPVCILGSDDEALSLVELVNDQPELGYRVVGLIGDAGLVALPAGSTPVLSPGPDIAEAVRRAGATGVIVPACSMPSQELDRLVRHLSRSGLYVQVSTGLSRVGQQRMRVSPLAHQVLFNVEAPNLSPFQFLLKRGIDVVLTSFALVFSAPLLLAAAVAIKLDDGGPVFYRQTRIGRDGVPFQVIKFRSMVTDASERLESLVQHNERNGPLFKLSRDPRVTRAGRVLRATSVDELPQLINVLRGDMSLVGPRPALPREVAQFDPELQGRVSVPPGITGLWQVEAADNPSFQAYRRLDLFYVDNWSVLMDIAILLSTVRVVLSRAVRSIRSDSDAAMVRRQDEPPRLAPAQIDQ